MSLFDLFRRRKSGRVVATADETSIAATHVDRVDVRTSDLDTPDVNVVDQLLVLQAQRSRDQQARLLRDAARQPAPKPRPKPRPTYPSAPSSQSSYYDPTPSIVASSSYSPSYSSDCSSSSSSFDSGCSSF